MRAQCFSSFAKTVCSLKSKTRHPSQDRGNTLDVAIRRQPLPEQERHDALQLVREKFLVLAKNSPGVRYKKGQWHVRIILPVRGKKMVIEKIDQHSPVKAETWIEPALAAKEISVLSCEGIDFPVKQNPLFDIGRETPVQPSLDKIAHEISDKDSRNTVRQKQVGKKVQNRSPIFFPSELQRRKRL